MTTRVVNIRQAPEWRSDAQCVYIGRDRTGKVSPAVGSHGYFGNPFALSPGEPRGSTIARFEQYARDRIANDAVYRGAVRGLKGKTLVCFCAPKACHGDVLAKLAEELNP